MTRHYPDLGSASDWCHEYGISALVSQTSFHGETVGGGLKCRLFSRADITVKNVLSIVSSIESVFKSADEINMR